MEISLVNIDKIPVEIMSSIMEDNQQKVTVSGYINSIHFTDGAIQESFDKAEDLDNLITYLKDEHITAFTNYDEVIEIMEKYNKANK